MSALCPPCSWGACHTPNKLTAAKQAFRNLEAERGEIAAGGFGPGDAYRALWFEVAEYRKEIASESRRRNPSINRIDFLRDKLVGTLAKLLPYERPRLAAITMAGDQNNPPRVKPDLSKLSEAELDQLEKIVLKVGGAICRSRRNQRAHRNDFKSFCGALADAETRLD